MKNTITTTIIISLLAACGARESEPRPTPAPVLATPPEAVGGADPTVGVAGMLVPDNNAPTAENPGAVAMSPLSLSWSVQKAEGALSIDYSVQNTGDAAVWLLDRTLVAKVEGVQPAYDRATLIAGDTPDLGRLVLGHLRPAPGHTVASEYTPGARKLDAGASATGHLSVPLPLAAWSPYLTLDPLSATPTRLVLELGWLSDDPPEGVPAWDEWTPVIGAKAGGPDLRIPTLSYTVQRQRLVRGETLPVP